ncbi:MAG: hypothetical protein ABI624_01960 [Casimicrobiaceae bacterium]
MSGSRAVAIVIALLGVACAAYAEYGTPRPADVEASFSLFAFEAAPFAVLGVLAALSPFGRALCVVGLALLAVEAYAYYSVWILPPNQEAALIYLRKPFIDLGIIAVGMLAGFLFARARET